MMNPVVCLFPLLLNDPESLEELANHASHFGALTRING